MFEALVMDSSLLKLNESDDDSGQEAQKSSTFGKKDNSSTHTFKKYLISNNNSEKPKPQSISVINEEDHKEIASPKTEVI